SLVPHQTDKDVVSTVIGDNNTIGTNHQLARNAAHRPIQSRLRRALELRPQLAAGARPRVHRIDALRRSPDERLRRLSAIDARPIRAEIARTIDALSHWTTIARDIKRAPVLIELRIAVRVLKAVQSIGNGPARARVVREDRARAVLRDGEPGLPRRRRAARVDEERIPGDAARRETGAADEPPRGAAVRRLDDPVGFVKPADQMSGIVWIDRQ